MSNIDLLIDGGLLAICLIAFLIYWGIKQDGDVKAKKDGKPVPPPRKSRLW